MRIIALSLWMPPVCKRTPPFLLTHTYKHTEQEKSPDWVAQGVCSVMQLPGPHPWCHEL